MTLPKTAIVYIILFGLTGLLFFNVFRVSGNILEQPVANGHDDARQDCTVSEGTRDGCYGAAAANQLWFGNYIGTPNDVCMAFGNITINNADTLNNATVTVRADYSPASGMNVNANVALHKGDNAPLDGTNCNAYLGTSPDLTANQTLWYITEDWQDGVNYATPDFKSSLQEIFDDGYTGGGDWESGNNIVVILWDSLTSTTFKAFCSYERTGCPAILEIDYTPSGGGVPEFTTWTLILTVGLAGVVILVVRQYVFKPVRQ